jgi:hypothetical protein
MPNISSGLPSVFQANIMHALMNIPMPAIGSANLMLLGLITIMIFGVDYKA